ncbi:MULTISPECIES: hypothetical protein [unclassified Chryseobacterium]|uniref:hypothetical protein n=1 Tax=unclassified Chryseobacterium TaxID=2593645 RepID=UPI000E0A1874|nr:MULTISPECIES: hypothetical protein [unclassified Chryseobacterium]MDQ1856134.1 hypothetical protein [Chryseobacterium sp. WLY505]
MKNLTRKQMLNFYGGLLDGEKYKVKTTMFYGYCSGTPGGQMIYSKYYAIEWSDGSVTYFNVIGNPVYSSN